MQYKKINVSELALQECATDVEHFKKSIKNECEELKSALRKLERVTSASEMNTIKNTVRDISLILDDAEPNLNELQRKIEEYEEYVRILKTKFVN